MTEPAPSPDAPAAGSPAPSVTARAPDRRGGRWVVSRADGASERINPDDGAQVRAAARALGVTPREIREAVARARETPPPEDLPAEWVEPRAWAWMEGGAPVPYPSLVAALTSPYAMARADGDAYALVDVDRDRARGAPWTPPELRALLRRPTPTPAYAWVTRSAGLRLVFRSCQRYGLTAQERAGLWVLQAEDVTRSIRTDKVDWVQVTRTLQGSELLRGDGEYGALDMRGALLRTGGLDSVSEDAVARLLADTGLEIGARYPHTRCLISPRPTSGTAPVVVTEGGVMCYVCSEFRPWAALVDGSGPIDPLAQMAAERVHWTHARYVLQAERPRCDPRYLRAGYAAMLKILHIGERAEGPPDERAEKALRRIWSPDRAYVRARGVWLRESDYAIHHPFTRGSVQMLPWTRGMPDRVDRAMSDDTLPGYVPVEPVLHLVDVPTWRQDTVLIPQVIASEDPIDDLDLEGAEDVLRAALPGVNSQWLSMVRVLVHAILRAQLRLAQPPIILLRGSSGAGKGALVALASGIVGRPTASLRFDGPRELAMSIGQGLESRACLLFGDELGKTESWWQHSRAILAMGSLHAWRRLHHGDVVSPVRAPVLLAGSTLPAGVLTMPELARRACVIELRGLTRDATAGWDTASREYLEVPRLEDLRTSGVGAAVAQAYVRSAREWILRRDRLPPWPDHAASLGAARLAQTSDMEELARIALGLYRLWTEGPDTMLETGARRRGWMRGNLTGTGDDAARLLADWIDEGAGRSERYARAQALMTYEIPGGIALRIEDTGSRMWVRFEAPESRSLDRLNRDVFPLLPPEAPDA